MEGECHPLASSSANPPPLNRRSRLIVFFLSFFVCFCQFCFVFSLSLIVYAYLFILLASVLYCFEFCNKKKKKNGLWMSHVAANIVNVPLFTFIFDRDSFKYEHKEWHTSYLLLHVLLASFPGRFQAAEKQTGNDCLRMRKNSVYFTDILQYTSRPTTVKTQCFRHVTQLHAVICSFLTSLSVQR